MAWTTQPYCTLSDVKLALDPNMTTTDDTFISSLIVQAQGAIDRYVGYPFQQDGTTQTPATRLYDGENLDTLAIDHIIQLSSTTSGAVFEIFTPTSLSSNGVWIVGNTTTTDITADVVLKPNNMIPAFQLKRRSGLPFEQGLQNYQVNGIFGEPILAGQTYPGVPNDITRACIRLSIHYYKMRDTNYGDMTQEQGGIRERFTKNMPVDVVEILERYRQHVFIGRWN